MAADVSKIGSPLVFEIQFGGLDEPGEILSFPVNEGDLIVSLVEAIGSRQDWQSVMHLGLVSPSTGAQVIYWNGMSGADYTGTTFFATILRIR